MSKTNNLVFTGLQIVAWIIFVGLCIQAGALLVNFVYSLFNPEIVKYLYNKLDLSALYQQDRSVYYLAYHFILIIAILKTVMFYWVVMLVTKLDLAKPFNSVVANRIKFIAYYALSIGFLSYLAEKTAEKWGATGLALYEYWEGATAFILMGAVIYIIAAIFKKGVEIQEEVDLTV